jgi:hypothetical protein
VIIQVRTARETSIYAYLGKNTSVADSAIHDAIAILVCEINFEFNFRANADCNFPVTGVRLFEEL